MNFETIACVQPHPILALREFVTVLSQDIRDTSLLLEASPTTKEACRARSAELQQVAFALSSTKKKRDEFGLLAYGSCTNASFVVGSDVNLAFFRASAWATEQQQPPTVEDLNMLGDAIQQAFSSATIRLLPSVRLPRLMLAFDEQALQGISFYVAPVSSMAETTQMGDLLHRFTEIHSSFLPVLRCLKGVVKHELCCTPSEITTTALVWSSVAFFRHHTLRLGTWAVTPGQLLFAFLQYFRAGGEFDPRRLALDPNNVLGVVPRETESLQSTWVVLHPVGNGHGSGGRPRENLAERCYLIHRFREGLDRMYHRIIANYLSTSFVLPVGAMLESVPSSDELAISVMNPRKHLVAVIMPSYQEKFLTSNSHSQFYAGNTDTEVWRGGVGAA